MYSMQQNVLKSTVGTIKISLRFNWSSVCCCCKVMFCFVVVVVFFVLVFFF